MATYQATSGRLGDHEVRRLKRPHFQQPAHQRVDPGVRRVGHHAERVTGPAEVGEVELDDRDPGAAEALTQGRRTPGVELHSEDPTACPCQRLAQRTGTSAEVHHEVTGTHG
jgi:hypothetical protein